MSIIKKTIQKIDLAQYRTWIIDTNPSSLYFKLSQFPEVFTAGKNSFLVNGSLELVSGTEVLVELIDSDGNPIFLSPIPRYLEGLARLVSIEIYDTTPPGLATLTILGQLKQDINGQSPPVEFINSYNVKWQRQISIAPTRHNISPIRTYAYPTASVSERIVSYQESSQSIQYITGGVITGIATNTIDSNAKLYYAIKASGSNLSFTREAEGGQFSCLVNGTPFSSSINSVLNSTTLFVDIPVTVSLASFLTSNYQIAYTSSASLVPTESSRSFADIIISNLDTFSGNIYRMKVFVKSSDNADSDYEMIDDTPTIPLNLLQTQSVDGNLLKYGFVKNQSMVDTYWTWGVINDSGSYYG